MKRKYRIKGYEVWDSEVPHIIVTIYVVQVRRWFGWVDVKTFYDPDDDDYALRCAAELLEMLNASV